MKYMRLYYSQPAADASGKFTSIREVGDTAISPKGTSLCQPRPSAWATSQPRQCSPNGAVLTFANHDDDRCSSHFLGPPFQGLRSFRTCFPRPMAWADIGPPRCG